MSQFEYIMVMVALILALALAQALRGLAEIVTSRKRYWPHSFWLVTIVFLMVQAWWADWNYNAVEEWRFTTYLLVLASPAGNAADQAGADLPVLRGGRGGRLPRRRQPCRG